MGPGIQQEPSTSIATFCADADGGDHMKAKSVGARPEARAEP